MKQQKNCVCFPVTVVLFFEIAVWSTIVEYVCRKNELFIRLIVVNSNEACGTKFVRS
jgi:hypothetical protein